MKQLLAVTAAALFLAACDTYPPGDPYGAPYPPYPPQDPYGAPYPTQDPYGTPPYPRAPIESCQIASSRDWRAWVDVSPGPDARPTLFVSGTVVAPTGGYRIEFLPQLQELRSYPVQVIARLLPIPPTGGATQALTTHDVRWQWPLQSGPVGSVTIACGDRTLAQVSPVQRAQ